MPIDRGVATAVLTLSLFAVPIVGRSPRAGLAPLGLSGQERPPNSVPAKLIEPKLRKSAPAQPEGLKVGTKAPDFTAFTVDGRPVSPAGLRGKIVILDFWATWCGPCQVSMPGLERIHRQVASKGVVVLSVNTWDEKSAFVKWVGENSGTKYHFDFVRDPAEGDREDIRKASVARRLYATRFIPTLYVIDRQGRIAGHLVGSGNEAGLVKILGGLGVRATVPAPSDR